MLYCTEYVKSHAARPDTVEQSIYDFPIIDTSCIQYMTLSSADDIPAAIAAGFCKKKLARAAIKAGWASLVSSEVQSMSDALYGRRTITDRHFDGGCSQHTRIELWEVPHLGEITVRFDY
jgi:hypothetical protein